MTRILLFSVMGFLLITLLGPVQSLLGFHMVVPDIPLIVMLYLVLGGRGISSTRSPSRFVLFPGGIDWSGGIAGFILGYVMDVMGGGLKGIHCLSMVLLFFASLWAARHVYLGGSLSVIVVTFFASLLASALGLGIRWLLGVPPGLGTLTIVLSQAALCAALAPVLMRFFRFLEFKLSQDSSDRGTLRQ